MQGQGWCTEWLGKLTGDSGSFCPITLFSYIFSWSQLPSGPRMTYHPLRFPSCVPGNLGVHLALDISLGRLQAGSLPMACIWPSVAHLVAVPLDPGVVHLPLPASLPQGNGCSLSPRFSRCVSHSDPRCASHPNPGGSPTGLLEACLAGCEVRR